MKVLVNVKYGVLVGIKYINNFYIVFFKEKEKSFYY